MKKKYFLNANIVDPYNSVEEVGGLIVNEGGKIEALGKKRVDSPQSRESRINPEDSGIID